MKKRLMVAVVLAMSFVLGSCTDAEVASQNLSKAADQTTEAPTTTVVETTTTTAAPTTTTAPGPTLDEAGAYYLEIVAPRNCVVTKIDSYAADGMETWEDVQGFLQLFGELAEADVALLDGLTSYDWPESVADTADDLAKAVSGRLPEIEAFSKLSSLEEFLDWEWDTTHEGGEAALLRSKLGLPSNIGDTNDWCEGIEGETPVTTTSEVPASTTTEPEPEYSRSQENAIRKAESYLDFMAFSRTGLIEQLEYEGFDTDEATFAVDYLDVDWNEQAWKKAESYLEFMPFSRSGLIDQLKYDGFTDAEATYAVDKAGL